MSEQKQLPRVLLLRVQNSIGKQVNEVWETQDPDIAKVILADGSTIYYDLLNRREVKSTTLRFLVESGGEEATNQLTGGKQPEKYNALISRDDVSGQQEETKMPAKSVKRAATKGGAKKTSSKKSSK